LKEYILASLITVLSDGGDAPRGAAVGRIGANRAVAQRSAGGRAGAASTEKIAGKIFFAVDPALPAIASSPTSIGRRATPAAGRVLLGLLSDQAEADRQGNSAVSTGVNRGGKGMLGFFNHAAGSLDPTSAADVGDGS
jgi:hypothetical protein